MPRGMKPFSNVIVCTFKAIIFMRVPSSDTHQNEIRYLKIVFIAKKAWDSNFSIGYTNLQFRCSAHFCVATSKRSTGIEQIVEW